MSLPTINLEFVCASASNVAGEPRGLASYVCNDIQRHCSGKKDKVTFSVSSTDIEFRVKNEVRSRKNLSKHYGKGNPGENIHLTVACVDISRVDGLASIPQFLRAWENPSTAGNWCILAVLHGGHYPLLQGAILDQMVLQYDVPVFLFHPGNREKVRESFGYITRYAAAVSGTLMWQHVYPDYNEQVRRSGGMRPLHNVIAECVGLSFASNDYNMDLVQALSLRFSQALLYAAGAGLPEVSGHSSTDEIDCMRLLGQFKQYVSDPTQYLQQLQSYNVPSSPSGPAARLRAVTQEEAAFRVHDYTLQKLWSGWVRADVVQLIAQVRAHWGLLDRYWVEKWAHEQGQWGGNFGGTGVGCTGVRTHVPGVVGGNPLGYKFYSKEEVLMQASDPYSPANTELLSPSPSPSVAQGEAEDPNGASAQCARVQQMREEAAKVRPGAELTKNNAAKQAVDLDMTLMTLGMNKLERSGAWDVTTLPAMCGFDRSTFQRHHATTLAPLGLAAHRGKGRGMLGLVKEMVQTDYIMNG